MTVMSSREFNHDTGRAKKAADTGPVFITDRGRPAHVLLSIEDYRRLTDDGKTIADCLAMPDAAAADFDPPKLGDLGLRPAEFD
jgi:prevent-host-death family protein